MDLLAGGVVDIAGPWTHRWVAANGARFHTAEAGTGPLVVFLHGFPEFWWAWRHQLPAVAGAGFHGVAMDLRGYGGSDKPPRGYDLFTLATDVAGIVRSLGATRAVLVGHGWGGFIAWATAVLHPHQVGAICVIGAPHPRRLRQPGTVQHVGSILDVLGYQVPILPERRLMAAGGAYVEELLHRWSAPGSSFPGATEASRYRAAMRLWPAPHCACEYYRWLIRSALRPDGRGFARHMRRPVTVPVLQLHGALDPAVRPEAAEGSQAYVTGTYRWGLLDGVGHFPHEESPDDVTKELLAWLATKSLLRNSR